MIDWALYKYFYYYYYYYSNPDEKLVYHFVQFSLTRLNMFNVLFQAEGCCVLKLAGETRILLRAYMTNFFIGK